MGTKIGVLLSNRLLFSLLLVGAALYAIGQSHAQQLRNPSEIVLHVGKDGKTPRNSEGSFISLAGGTILFAYSKFENESGDHARAHIAGRFSEDGGSTWTEHDDVILQNEGDMNVMSVSFLRLKDGSIALVYARKNSLDDCIPYIRISTDEAKTWSDPVRIIPDREGYFVVNNDRVVQLASGRLLVPVSRHKTKGVDFSMRGTIFCYFSDDMGKTWTSSAEVPNPQDVVLQEPGVVQLEDGDIAMWLRTDTGVQYLSRSQDQGITWQPVVPSDIPSPRAPASIKRIPATGDLLLVWNDNDGSDAARAAFRTPLTAAISTDEGTSWTPVKVIENDPEGFFCYTAIAFVGDQVLLGYMAAERTELAKRIPLVLRKVPLQEFYTMQINL
ncbi:sialidase family protein [Cyclobacterium xiamenense]|uniref:sialidase family protein n=1 Tax=Cyclobacterium xiamenense TaxID=1297121 RepID=UPI0012B8FF68|nr:sialidase family protein [Cyclobacterium xiamenense]